MVPASLIHCFPIDPLSFPSLLPCFPAPFSPCLPNNLPPRSMQASTSCLAPNNGLPCFPDFVHQKLPTFLPRCLPPSLLVLLPPHLRISLPLYVLAFLLPAYLSLSLPSYPCTFTTSLTFFSSCLPASLSLSILITLPPLFPPCLLLPCLSTLLPPYLRVVSLLVPCLPSDGVLVAGSTNCLVKVLLEGRGRKRREVKRHDGGM